MIKIKKVFIVLIFILVSFPACSLWTSWEIKTPSAYFTPDKFLVVEERPFFPIGIYSVNPPFAFTEIKEAGFNTVHTYDSHLDYLKTYINHAEKVGVKVLVYPGGRLERDEFDIKTVELAVIDLMNSSAVLAWYLSDEPDGGEGVLPKRVKDVKDLVHQLDPSHPTAVVIYNPLKVKDYAETSDIIMVDPYPIHNQYPLIKVAEAIDVAKNAVDGKKPIWAVLQAFGYQNDRYKGWGEREPTYHEMKAMTYLAIARGAKGIFYYTYHGSQYFIEESPRHWRELKAIVGELRLIYPLLILPEILDFELDITVSGSGKSPFFWTVRKVSEESFFLKAGTYLIIVNSANYPVTTTFTLKDNLSADIKVIFENRKLVATDGNFSDSFVPYEVHIYNLK